MRFEKYITEKSFEKSDIPRTFRVALDIEEYQNKGNRFLKKLKELAKGELKGVTGISSSGTISYQFFGVARDGLLIMPGKETVELNKLSRFMYGSVDYFLSDGMKNLKRIWQKSGSGDEQQLMFNLNEYTFKAMARSGKIDKYFIGRSAPHQSMAYYVSSRYRDNAVKPNINSSKDYYKWFMKVLKLEAEEDDAREFSKGWRREFYEPLKDMSYSEFRKYLEDAFKELGDIYGEEEEWVVKNKILKVPKNSTLYILRAKIDKKLMKNRMWMDMNKSTIKNMEDFEDALKKTNIKSKMRVKIVDTKEWERVRKAYFKRKYPE